MKTRHGALRWAWVLGLSALLGLPLFGQAELSVVPYPQEVVWGKGHFSPAEGPLQLYMGGLSAEQSELLYTQLADVLSPLGHAPERIDPAEVQARKPRLWIGIPAADPELMALAERTGLQPDASLGQEGYLLRIEKKRICIFGQSEAGVFYGVQSLVQMLRAGGEAMQLPQLSIRDWPDIDFRCIMDDISRGPIPTMAFMKAQVRRYAEMKINRMSFYIEHVVETEAFPDFAPAAGGISVAEFRALSEYAADYHIRLVGNFQSLGHFEHILSHPQYRHLGATERMLDPLNPEAIDFLRSVYREMAPAFSDELFTPDLDEAWDLSRGGLKGPAAELGVEKIYADHVLRIDSTLRGLNKRSLVWADIIRAHPGILELLPKDIVLGAWDYSAVESFASWIDPLRDAGFDFTVSPGILNSRRLIPDFDQTFINIRNFINEGYEKGCLGVYCTVWDDGGLHFFSHDWYGVAYTAEQCWRPNRDPREAFDRRFSRAVYADQANALPRALRELNRLTLLEPTYEMNSNVFFKALVPARGEVLYFDPLSWKEVRDITDRARALLDEAVAGMHSADLDYIRFTMSQYRFMADARHDLLAASAAYARACGMQNDDRAAAMLELVEACRLSGALGKRFDLLAADFLALWDGESRLHWRDRAAEAFGVHSRALAEQHRLLKMAMAAFGRGSVLPPPADLRLDIRPQESGFFPYWLVCGSFHLDSFDLYRHDFLSPMGGEAAAQPYPGERFTDDRGEERMWDKFDAPGIGGMDFTKLFDPFITAVGYAYCVIKAPADMEVTALLGSNDGATVWCNGEEVHRVHGKRSLIPDEDAIPLSLKAGNNHLLIKVEQWKGGWGLSFRLKDLEVRNHKHKYHIQSGGL